MDDQRTDREGCRIRFRKLRIAWSAAFGLSCVLLCMLWARSYWWIDNYYRPFSGKFLVIESYEGELTFGFPAPSTGWEIPQDLTWWGGQSILMPEHHVDYTTHTSYADDASLFKKLIRAFRTEPGIGIVLPSWFLVGLSAALAIAPWIRHLSWRFSLRTLLIAMTVLAVVMGLVLYASMTGPNAWWSVD